MSAQLQVTGEAKIRDIQGPVVANSGVITALDGAASQYVRGDGTLADFPTSTGGGSSVSYYLNGSINQGTFGGSTYYEMSKTPIIGAGTDFAVSTNGLVAQFITDANDPDLLEVPGGNFNVEFYFSVSNNTGNPTVYAELYKYNGATFTLLGSSQAIPESINQGTTIAPYYFAIPVGTAALNNTDRIAIRIYANVDGRTVTLHTENSHLCQVVTTFSKGMISLNNLTKQNQYFATGTSGTNFAIVSSGDTHTFNLPVASATNTGKLSNTDWANFNAAYNDKINSAAVTGTTTKTLTLNQQDGGTITASWTDDNTDAVTSVFGRTGAVVAASGDYTTTQVTEGTNLYFTNARAQNAITLTTTGTSGAATYSGGTLNIPQYQGVLTNPVTGTGTTNTLPKFTAASTIDNSNITDTGTLITLGSNSYVNGSFGVGVTPLTQVSLRVNKNVTGNATSTGISQAGTVQSDVTIARGILNTLVTQAAVFTLPEYWHFQATQSTIGSGNIISNQIGYYVDSTLIGATNNYAFRSDLGAGTNRWNLYMNGTANNYMAGSLGIGATNLTGINLFVSKTLTGSVDSYHVNVNGVIQSDVTNSATYFRSSASTAAASFALGSLFHYVANQGSLGAGSSVGTQSGFQVNANLIGATNNFGFRGLIPAGTNRWNLFMDGTANNYMAGSLGIGSTALTNTVLKVAKSNTGATAFYGITSEGATQSDVTSQMNYFATFASTQATAFTLGSIVHFRANQSTFGVGSTVTNQYGFLVDATAIGATNNYGFYGNIASGTNRWNLYMAGTASNYLAGKLLIGSTTDSGATFQVTGTGKFTGDVELNGASGTRTLTIQNNTSGNAVLALVAAGSNSGTITYSRSTSELVFGNSGATSALKIAATGAATFSNLAGTGNRIVGADSSGLLSSITVGSGLSLSAGVLTATGGSAGTVTGSGSSSQVPFWTSASNISGDNAFIWDNTNKRFGVGTTSPSASITAYSTTAATQFKSAGVAPAMTFSDTLTSATYAAVFGLATSNNQFITGTATGDFAIANQSTTAGGIVFGTGTTEKMRMSSGGNFLIGTSTDNGYKLQINGSASFAYGFTNVFRGSSAPNDILVGNTGSTFYVGGSVTATGGFFDTSDSRLKIVINDYDNAKGIEKVEARLYLKNNKKELGYFAQDVQEILPSAVSEGEDGFLTLSYSQVHTAKIAYLEDKVAQLEELIKKLL